ncbi:MAG: hypothetical protein J6A59_11180 [Lachnospiraceae bacterium]|nr:hypothetical protein [Lachnospiraceae bacterium]
MKAKKRFSILCILLVLMLSLSAVFATEDTRSNSTIISEHIQQYGRASGGNLLGTKLTKGVHFDVTSDNGGDPMTFTLSGGDVTIYMTQEQMDKAVDQILKSEQAIEQSHNVNEKVNEVTGGLNIGADVGTANTLLSGFTPIVSTFLGLMCVIITLGMAIFSAIDIVYIVFPPFQSLCEDQKAAGKGATVRSNGTSWVSREAQKAVEASNTDQSDKNPLIIYFGKRIVSYIVLAILLFMLFTGNITLITDLALKAVSGIMEVLGAI